MYFHTLIWFLKAALAMATEDIERHGCIVRVDFSFSFPSRKRSHRGIQEEEEPEVRIRVERRKIVVEMLVELRTCKRHDDVVVMSWPSIDDDVHVSDAACEVCPLNIMYSLNFGEVDA